MSKFLNELINPVCIAPAGYCYQDVSNVGAIFTKTITFNKCPGNTGNVFKVFDDGLVMNRLGLPSNGLYHFVQSEINELDKLSPEIVVSIFAKTVDVLENMIGNLCEYSLPKFSAIELNMSCPNVSSNQINDLYFYTKRAVDLASQYKVPVSVKLPPDVNRIVGYAQQAEHAGVSFLSISNTIPGLTKEENGDLFLGGISGPKLKPISQRCVYEVRKKLPDIGIVGIGGVENLTDVDEYVSLGADAVGIVTAEIVNPGTASRIAGEWLQRHFGKDLKNL